MLQSYQMIGSARPCSALIHRVHHKRKNKSEVSKVTCILQDFPYNFEEGVTHHNLWSEVPLTHEEILKVTSPCQDSMSKGRIQYSATRLKTSPCRRLRST